MGETQTGIEMILEEAQNTSTQTMFQQITSVSGEIVTSPQSYPKIFII